jgi:mRNA interferase RelE/StbE
VTGGQQVRYTTQAERDMRRLDAAQQERIRGAVRRFAETGQGDVKKLQGRDREWRLRVGTWRAIFTFEQGRLVVLVLRVLPRRDAY